MKRLALGIADGAPLGLGARMCGRRPRAAELPRDIEGIIGAQGLGKRSARSAPCAPLAAAGAADHADLPCRQMTREGILLITRHGIVAHTGEKIIGVVVFPNVIETEPPIFALAVA